MVVVVEVRVAVTIAAARSRTLFAGAAGERVASRRTR